MREISMFWISWALLALHLDIAWITNQAPHPLSLNISLLACSLVIPRTILDSAILVSYTYTQFLETSFHFILLFFSFSTFCQFSYTWEKYTRQNMKYHSRHLVPCLCCHPHTYIRLVQHLIERCLILGMSRDQCVKTLADHAGIRPLITLTVWKELLKENKDFFRAYFYSNISSWSSFIGRRYIPRVQRKAARRYIRQY